MVTYFSTGKAFINYKILKQSFNLLLYTFWNDKLIMKLFVNINLKNVPKWFKWK